jgi:hypothetical protein
MKLNPDRVVFLACAALFISLSAIQAIVLIFI